MKFFDDTDTKVFALGGLGEVGKNMYCVMHGNEIIITDAGMTFPEGEQLGIDYVIPDVTFLKKNENKIKALFITHGHEDHIGAIPFLLQTVNIPYIYAPNQAVGLIRKKLEDRNIQYKNLIIYNEKTKVKFKNIEVEFFRTTHSIPDSHGFCITTPNGRIVTTGDFKFDLTPIGPMANLHKMAEIGKRGVTLLLSDSTNALNEGMSKSESKVDDALYEILKKEKGRVIIATFASNIYRLKHIVDNCKKTGRKITTFGRSMENNIEISIQGGYIKNKEIFISAEEANKLPPSKVCLLCTGSQGEPLAALSRIADGSHKYITLRPDSDVVVFSSSAIPGNALSISRTINKLYLKGVKVYTNTSLSDVHTSGHAYEEELKLMIRLINPTYVMPFHGEYRMLKKHADIAVDCGIPKENTFVLENGDVLSIRKGKIKKSGKITTGDTYVDGNRIGDIGSAVIRDRKVMANDGIIVVIANINMRKSELLGKVNITTRGFVQVNENEELLKEIENIAKKTIINKLNKNNNFSDIKTEIITVLSNYAYEKTGRKPIILPVIMDIK
mgnify:CR=1 FL=1